MNKPKHQGLDDMGNEENKNVLSFHKAVKKRRRKLTVKFMTLLLVIVLAVSGIMFSPIFAIKNIEITKLNKYTEAEICSITGLSKGMNLFAFNRLSAAKKLKTIPGKKNQKNPYIEDVKISIELPDTIKFNIKERKVRGYVPYMGSYLYIDEYGRVLDVQTAYTEPLPLVKGLDFSEGFRKGELLKVKNQESFDVIVKIAQLMTKYELLDIVVEVDVSDPSNIKARVNKVDVLLGDVSDSDEKIRTMAEIIRNMPEGSRGSLDLRDLTKPWVLQYLT